MDDKQDTGEVTNQVDRLLCAVERDIKELLLETKKLAHTLDCGNKRQRVAARYMGIQTALHIVQRHRRQAGI